MCVNFFDVVGGVFWFGMDDVNMIVFIFVYCCIIKVLVCYMCVDGVDYIIFFWNFVFWIFNWVVNMVYFCYDLMIGDVCVMQNEFEIIFNEVQEGIEVVVVKLYEKNLEMVVKFLINYIDMIV